MEFIGSTVESLSVSELTACMYGTTVHLVAFVNYSLVNLYWTDGRKDDIMQHGC